MSTKNSREGLSAIPEPVVVSGLDDHEVDSIQSEVIPIGSMVDIGRWVRERRKLLHMTQAEAAHFCHVGTRFLSELENGKATAEMGKVLQVLSSLGFELIMQLRRNKVQE